MDFKVTRVEVQGWLNLIVAIAGLYFTATSGGDTLDALARIGSAGQLPAEFGGAQGAIRVFVFLLMLVVFGMMFFIGLGIMLAQLFRQMGASDPIHTAFTLMGALVAGVITLTLGIFGHPLWIIGFLGTIVLFVSTGVAANQSPSQDGESAYWLVMILGGVGAILCGGVGILFSTSVPASAPSAEVPAAVTSGPTAESK